MRATYGDLPTARRSACTEQHYGRLPHALDDHVSMKGSLKDTALWVHVIGHAKTSLATTTSIYSLWSAGFRRVLATGVERLPSLRCKKDGAG